MELEIRLMNWKWMLFSEALKSIFLPPCLVLTFHRLMEEQPRNQSRRSQNEIHSFHRFTPWSVGNTAADSKSGKSLRMKENRVNQGL